MANGTNHDTQDENGATDELKLKLSDQLHIEFAKKMHQDILEHVKRRYTTNAAKIALVVGLVGLGGAFKLNAGPTEWWSKVPFFCAPLVALFWDILFFEQNFAMARLTSFIRMNSKDFPLEASWENYVREVLKGEPDVKEKAWWLCKGWTNAGSFLNNYFRRLYVGLLATTGLIWAGCFGVAYELMRPCPVQSPPWFVTLWFLGIAVLWLIIACWDDHRHRAVDGFEKRTGIH